MKAGNIYLSIFICSIETVKHNNWKEQWNRMNKAKQLLQLPNKKNKSKIKSKWLLLVKANTRM